MFNLRSYQTDLISRIAADFSSGIQRVCAVAPCGAGKTVVVGWMAGKTALVNKRVLFLVHRRELIDQSDRTFTAMRHCPTVKPNPFKRVKKYRNTFTSFGLKG